MRANAAIFSSTATAGAKQRYRGEHNRAARYRNKQSDAQAVVGVAGNHSDQRRHAGSAGVGQGEHDYAKFSGSLAKPLGKPSDPNRIEAGESNACKEGASEKTGGGTRGEEEQLAGRGQRKSPDRKQG